MFIEREIRRMRTLMDASVTAEDVLDADEMKILTVHLKTIKDKMIVPAHKNSKKTITVIKVLTADLDMQEFFYQVIILYAYIYIYVYIPVYIHVYIPVYIHVYIPVYIHVYIPVYIHVYIPVYINVYIPVYINVYTYIYMYIYINIHKLYIYLAYRVSAS